jgi:hypothetical protein
VHTSCDSRTAIVFVSEGSERVKTATLSFKLNHFILAVRILRFNGIFELIEKKKSITLPRGRDGPYACESCDKSRMRCPLAHGVYPPSSD